jgi:ABC-type phosphate/phosphonate transport system substrate-binding protein
MLAVIALLAASGAAADERPLVLVVMDPLAAPLACDCVKGYAQRNYDVLGMYLRDKLGRPVRVVYGESLAKAIRGRGDDRVDLVIGKDSVVRFDAAERGLAMEPIARLTGKDGKTTLTGLVVVPSRDSARVLADLKGYRVFFGPAASVEKHAAAIDGLRKAGVAVPEKPEVVEGCSEAALAAIESDAKPGAAAVISSYALALLEGCGSIRKGELRIVGETEPTPFVTAFVPKSTPPALRSNILDGLIAMKEHPAMLLLMESQSGFVPVETPEPPAGKPADGGADKPAAPAATKGDLSAALGIPDRQWLQWRGRDRNAVVGWLPERLPAEPRVVWSRPMTGSGLAGIVATEDRVVVADRDPADRLDVVRCLEAASGEQVWQIEYPAPGKLDYGNSPRATPVVYEGRVYLLGAMGDLHCVTLADGAVVWKKNVLAEFGANRPNWGMCGSPLVVDGKLIVNPGAEAASVAALDPATGKVLWQSPGLPPAYSSFIVGRFGGAPQIVGYDAVSLGG